MSAIAIILIVLGVLLVVGLTGGYLATLRRDRLRSTAFDQHVTEADQALEAARSADKGWDRAIMERAARDAATDAGAIVDELHLVLVDDRPGVSEDRAHFVAIGPEGESRIVLSRQGDSWVPDSVD